MPNRRDSRRRRRRRRGGGLGVLIKPLSVLLAAVAIVAALTLFFKVEHVEVSGNQRYMAEEIISASAVQKGDNLILFDKYGASQRIYTQLPYITAVRINRKLPDTLLVEVTETQAAAAIHSADAWWLLGISGGEMKVLEAVEDLGDSGCLQITGLEAAEPAVGKVLQLAEGSPVTTERLMELFTAMEKLDLLDQVSAANFSSPDTLALWYDDRFRVELFYDADYDYKMTCLAEVAARMEPNERGTIRMTMDDDSEVRFIPSAQTQ